MRQRGAFGATAILAALLFTPGAQASFHLVKVSEVYAGAADDAGDYIELQMFTSNQNFFGGHSVSVHGPDSAPIATIALANVFSGQNQRTLLIGDAVGIPGGATPDVAASLNLPEAGGAVCFADAAPPDCVAWGAAGNTAMLPGDTGTPAPAIAFGSSLTRSTAPGCPTLLEAADDTDVSAADFAPTTPTPRNNAGTPTETPCGGGGGGGGADTNPPNTEITKQPKKRSAKPGARVEFRSSESGSRFECKLDRKPFASCSSPFRKKVKVGKHKFEVRAIDAAGNADPTPATARFRRTAE